MAHLNHQIRTGGLTGASARRPSGLSNIEQRHAMAFDDGSSRQNVR
jgi:hypothetical protein